MLCCAVLRSAPFTPQTLSNRGVSRPLSYLSPATSGRCRRMQLTLAATAPRGALARVQSGGMQNERCAYSSVTVASGPAPSPLVSGFAGGMQHAYGTRRSRSGSPRSSSAGAGIGLPCSPGPTVCVAAQQRARPGTACDGECRPEGAGRSGGGGFWRPRCVTGSLQGCYRGATARYSHEGLAGHRGSCMEAMLRAPTTSRRPQGGPPRWCARCGLPRHGAVLQVDGWRTGRRGRGVPLVEPRRGGSAVTCVVTPHQG